MYHLILVIALCFALLPYTLTLADHSTILWIVPVLFIAGLFCWWFLVPFLERKPRIVTLNGAVAFRYPLLSYTTNTSFLMSWIHTILGRPSSGAGWFGTLFVTMDGVWLIGWRKRFIPFVDISHCSIIDPFFPQAPSAQISLVDHAQYGFSFYRKSMRTSFAVLLQKQRIPMRSMR